MSSNPENPYQESDLDSPAYRQRLKRKLDCLIAVLEVAGAKVRRSLAAPDADLDRLTKIETNLKQTLTVCQRAKRALDRREALPTELRISLDKVVGRKGLQYPQTPQKSRSRPRGMVIEMSSAEEYERFRELDPVASSDIADCDLDDLCARLQADA